MSYLLKINSRIRLQLGLVIFGLALIGLYFNWNYNVGFFGGFITGILLGLGFGLIVTYKKQE